MKISIHDVTAYIQTEKPENLEKGDIWVKEEAEEYMEFAQMFDRLDEIIEEIQDGVEIEVPEDDEPETGA